MRGGITNRIRGPTPGFHCNLYLGLPIEEPSLHAVLVSRGGQIVLRVHGDVRQRAGFAATKPPSSEFLRGNVSWVTQRQRKSVSAN